MISSFGEFLVGWFPAHEIATMAYPMDPLKEESMAKSTSTRNSNTWETGTCKRPEQEAQRLRPRGSGPGRRRAQEPLLIRATTKYKLINTRRGRAYGSRARAEGMDMRSLVKEKESCLFINQLSPLGSKQQASQGCASLFLFVLADAWLLHRA